MDEATYKAQVEKLFDEQDKCRDRLNELAAEIDAVTFEAHNNGEGLSAKRMAQIWDVVPGAIYIRLKRHRAKNGL